MTDRMMTFTEVKKHRNIILHLKSWKETQSSPQLSSNPFSAFLV